MNKVDDSADEKLSTSKTRWQVSPRKPRKAQIQIWRKRIKVDDSVDEELNIFETRR